MKRQLHKYQQRAARFLYDNPRSGIFADPGAGKTLTTLAVLRKLSPPKVLIIAPMRVCQYVWPAEIEKWGFGFTAHFLHGRDKTAEHSGANIELINPEGIKWLVATREPEYDVLIVDESSQFKNGRSVRFKLLKPWLREIPRIHILTGTPTPKSMMDLWAQIYLLDQGATLGTFITHYRRRWFAENRFRNFSEWVIRDGAEQDIWRRIAPLVHRVDADIDLPELLENPIAVAMPAGVQKIYKDMWAKLAAEIEGEMYLTPSAATKYQVCCQIASGALYDDEKNVTELHTAKIDALRELIGELHGKPILIGFKYRHEGDRIKKAFKCPVIMGGIAKKETDHILKLWNTGELPILAAQAQTISHGLNLQSGGCNDVCWFSLTDDFDRFEQFNRRVYRQGMTGTHCRIHYLMAAGTLDALILKRLRDRKLMQLSLFEFLRDYAISE